MLKQDYNKVAVIYQSLQQLVANLKNNMERCKRELELNPGDSDYWNGRKDGYKETLLQLRISVNVMGGYLEQKEEDEEAAKKEMMSLTINPEKEEKDDEKRGLPEAESRKPGEQEVDTSERRLATTGSEQPVGKQGEGS